MRQRRKISLEELSENHPLVERTYDEGSEYPTPEQAMVREGIRRLTVKQRQVWDLYNYDKLTQDEIARRLGKKRTTIETQLQQCERKIVKWCKASMETYKLIKREVGED